MDLRNWMSSGIRLLAAVSLVAGSALLGVGCESGDEPSETSETSGQSSSKSKGDDEGDEPSAQPDTGTRSGDTNWRTRVEQALKSKSGPDASSGSESGDEGGAEACTLFPDSCGEGESCFVVRGNRTRCGTYDPEAGVGTTCRRADDCNDGHQCVGGRPGTCRRLCKPGTDKWGCGEGTECAPVGDGGEPLDWGVCREEDDECETWPDDSCGMGRACVQTDLGFRCREVPFATENGEPCPDGPVDCSVDQACVRLDDGDQECRPKCDDDHPCDSGECATLEGRPWGFCAQPR